MPHTISATNLNALSAPSVRRTLLVRMDFPTGVVAVHPGSGPFDFNGDTYKGVGKIGTISSIEETTDGKPRAVTFALSGLDPDLRSKVNAGSYRGRDVDVYYMLFNEMTNQPLTSPWHVWAGYMDTLRVSTAPDLSGALKLDLVLTAESILVKLRRRNTRRRTNEDQQARFPGDRFFEFVDQLRFHQVEFGGTAVVKPGAGGSIGDRDRDTWGNVNRS